MDRVFKIRASAASKILGRMGLTDVQLEKMAFLKKRVEDSLLPIPKQKPLTPVMQKELDELIKKHNDNSFMSLPQTAKSYLAEWFANDFDDTQSKYTLKGDWVENELIDFAAEKLGLGVQEKNKVRNSDEYFEGECDVNAPKIIVDVKAPWDKKRLNEQALKPLDWDYEIQMIVYCHLYDKPEGCVFYGLMDTPGDLNRGTDIFYSDELSDDERWFAYRVKANPEIIKALVGRVMLCRQWLEWYELQLKNKLGKVS